MTDALADQQPPGSHGQGPRGPAPIEAALDVIGDKWVPGVLEQLSTDSLSYRQLLTRLSGIQQSMLTRTLHNMERNGLINRAVLPTAPPQTRYSLTELARSLEPVLAALEGWGGTHGAEIEAARLHYESAAILRRAYS